MRDGQIDSPEAAATFLAPYGTALGNAVRSSHDDWNSLLQGNPEGTAGLSTTLRARYIHDRTVYRLAVVEAGGKLPGLRLTKIHGLYVVILEDKLMLKLKKLDAKLRSRNIRTGQTSRFNKQGSLLGEDFGVVTNATSGYVLDELGTQIDRVVVVCWDGSERPWQVDLLENEGDEGSVVVIPAAPAPRPSRTRVVVDRPAEADEAASPE